MMLLYGNGFADNRMSFKPLIFSNTVEAMQILLKAMDEKNKKLYYAQNADHKKLVMDYSLLQSSEPGKDVLLAIQRLWTVLSCHIGSIR
jgi:hypothetical protein